MKLKSESSVLQEMNHAAADLKCSCTKHYAHNTPQQKRVVKIEYYNRTKEEKLFKKVMQKIISILSHIRKL
jgi:hypothetical protein